MGEAFCLPDLLTDLVQGQVLFPGNTGQVLIFRLLPPDAPALRQLPGQKLIMKGNHDYWWSTANKMNAYLKAEG